MKKKLVVGILAHVDSGKTTLSEALLYETGVIRSLGRVDNQDAFLDTDTVERERGITIYSKNARISLDDIEIILIDTPGHIDFSTEMERTLNVLDLAILLVSAPQGVQSHTRTLWSLLKSYKIPTFIFVNKMDMAGTDKEKTLFQLKKELSNEIIDFMQDEAAFYEELATCSEALLNEYLNKLTIDENHIISAINNRAVFPVFFGSALKLQGVSEFVDALKKWAPVPSKSTNNPFSGFVYKISRDPQNKRLTFIKILSGSLKIKSMLDDEKVNEIRIYSGNSYENVSEVFAGDICAVVGLANSSNSQVYGQSEKSIISPILSPALSYAIHYPRDIDRTTMITYLKELEEEDPSLNIDYKEQTHEIFVSLMGDVQTEVLKRTLHDRYNINVSFSDGKICYKETIKESVEGVGHFEPLRHYAEVHIKLSPLERGSGLEFETDISEDILSKNWQRLIMTHMMEKEHRGVLTGSPITDLKMTLVSGKAHIKHTEGGDFRQATYRAIRQGLMELMVTDNCQLLEPYYAYTLEIPSDYTGRAMTDILSMSGTCTISENDIENNITILIGRAPVSKMNGYTKEVTAYSKGLGKLYLSLSGYDICHNEDEVLSTNTYNPDSDLRNPSSSVFCSHGAGTVIPWDEVSKYMHIEYQSGISPNTGSVSGSFEAANAIRKKYEQNSDLRYSISLEEIEQILHSSTHSNEKGRQGSFKGISKATRDRRKYGPSNDMSSESAAKYKDAKIKDKYILVDGYNVVHAFKELSDIASVSLDGAASRLNDILCNYQAITNVNVMVVYDAYKVKGHPLEENKYNNITVIYTKEAQTADQYIERYAHENSSKYDITVVTSDGLEQIIVTGNGASVISSREFEDIIKNTFSSFNEFYNVK